NYVSSSTIMLASFLLTTARPDRYPLSLHDALPIFVVPVPRVLAFQPRAHPVRRCSRAEELTPQVIVDPDNDLRREFFGPAASTEDRKSTRLNSSHDQISYAVFCLKKKKNTTTSQPQ